MAHSPLFLIVGCGSIGQRHIANLLSLGVKNLLGCDASPQRRGQVEARFDVPSVESLSQGLERNPKVALIATPTSLHVPQALEAARHGCHLFIEKPLGDRLDGVDQLAAAVSQHRLITLVGCNMRFHHGPSTIRKLLVRGSVGSVVTALIDAGQYLPDWHPGEDYRQWYSAKASLGGGVVLDGVHEIDYARWLFGEVAAVYAQGGKVSSLEIDTEDSINILMQVVSGYSVSIHMDYIQRTYWRTCKVIGEEGTIYWDITPGEVRLFSAKDKGWTSFPPPPGYSINQMYLDEMRHFLACLRGEEQPSQGLGDAKKVLEIALAVKGSMLSGEKRKLLP